MTRILVLAAALLALGGCSQSPRESRSLAGVLFGTAPVTQPRPAYLNGRVCRIENDGRESFCRPGRF